MCVSFEFMIIKYLIKTKMSQKMDHFDAVPKLPSKVEMQSLQIQNIVDTVLSFCFYLKSV